MKVAWRRFRQLEYESEQLKKMVERRALDIDALEVVFSEKQAHRRSEKQCAL
jgi:hypothetical protein